ncbi:Mu transposase domain-containing protein [Nocardia xishanensis]
MDFNDYSVHPCAIGRKVDIRAELHQVVIACGGTEVGRHQRCWASHQTISDPAHVTAAAEMRRSRRLAVVPVLDTSVEHRDLADYDRLFDLDSEGVA